MRRFGNAPGTYGGEAAGGSVGGAVRRDIVAGALIFGLGLGIGAVAGARPDSGLTGREDGRDAVTPRDEPSIPYTGTPYGGLETVRPPFFFVAPHPDAPSHGDSGRWAM